MAITVRFRPTGWEPVSLVTESIAGTAAGLSSDVGTVVLGVGLVGESAGTSSDVAYTPLVAGIITEGTHTASQINATASAATGGSGTYTYQWYGDASPIGGQTTLTLAWAGREAETAYDVHLVATDTVTGLTVTYSAVEMTTEAGPSAPTITITTGAAANVFEQGELQLSVSTTGNPAPTVSYESSDADVATVSSSGLVTAVGEPDETATITATATNSEGSDSADITITVTEIPEPSELYANLPAGGSWTDIGTWDGSVLQDEGGHGLGIQSFGGWSNLSSGLFTVVPDASNPYGSGFVIRQFWEGGDPEVRLRRGTFAEGEFRELYIQLSVFYEAGWSIGHKLFYFGADVAHRSQGDGTNHYAGCSANWPTALQITTQNGSTGGLDSYGGALRTGEWLNIETYFRANSAIDVADGQSRIAVNGVPGSPKTGLDWNCIGFSGWDWYGNSNGGPDGYLRLGGGRIAVRSPL